MLSGPRSREGARSVHSTSLRGGFAVARLNNVTVRPNVRHSVRKVVSTVVPRYNAPRYKYNADLASRNNAVFTPKFFLPHLSRKGELLAKLVDILL